MYANVQPFIKKESMKQFTYEYNKVKDVLFTILDSPIKYTQHIGGTCHFNYQAEILTSHELVNQITHLENLIQQADLIIFGEGLKEEDQILETTTIRIAELTQQYSKPAIAICATNDKFDLFESLNVTAMFNTFIDMPDSYTDFKMGIQIRHYAVQALKLLKTQINLPLSS